MSGSVSSVQASDDGRFSKEHQLAIQLRQGGGEVVLIDEALYRELGRPDLEGRRLFFGHGDLGENITTSALDITSLPRGTMLHFSPKPFLVPESLGTSDLHDACVILTGVVSTGPAFDRFSAGLSDRINRGGARPVGVVGVVARDGFVMKDQRIRVEEPSPETFRRLTALENTNGGRTEEHTNGTFIASGFEE